MCLAWMAPCGLRSAVLAELTPATDMSDRPDATFLEPGKIETALTADIHRRSITTIAINYCWIFPIKRQTLPVKDRERVFMTPS